MRFGIIDHNDDTGRPHVRQVAERLELIEAYDRLGFYAYHLTEHHGTPLAVTPSPHLMLAAAAQRTSRLRLGTLITILSDQLHGTGNMLRRHDQAGGVAVSGTPGHRGDAALRLIPRPPALAHKMETTTQDNARALQTPQVRAHDTVLAPHRPGQYGSTGQRP